MPTVAVTTWVNNHHGDGDSIFQGSSIPTLTQPPLGSFAVGFQYAFDPDASWYSAWAYRGTVLFKIADIPPHFTKATLVLTVGQALSSDPSFNVPFTGIFETATTLLLPPVFASAGVRLSTTNPRLTVVSAAGTFLPVASDPSLQQHPVIAHFPSPPYPKGAMVQETTPFNYRIDVTTPVNNWFALWPTRGQTPLRGFVLIGTDESLPQTSNSTLLISYSAQLEFDIDEPDR
jgi:hypothetical protein